MPHKSMVEKKRNQESIQIKFWPIEPFEALKSGQRLKGYACLITFGKPNLGNFMDIIQSKVNFLLSQK